MLWTRFITVDVDLDQLGWGGCPVSPLYTVLVFFFLILFPYFLLWKEVTICSSHSRSGKFYATSLEKSIYIKLFCKYNFYTKLQINNYLESIFAQNICYLLHLFTYSIIYFHQHELMDIYLILWVTTQYDFILLLTPLLQGFVCLFVLAYSYFLTLQDTLGSFVYFLPHS